MLSSLFVRAVLLYRWTVCELRWGLLTFLITQAFLYDHDNRFFVGWELDKSWILCTVSWIVIFLDSLGVVGAALFMAPEDDYEPVPEPRL